jgi:hypothetical protein
MRKIFVSCLLAFLAAPSLADEPPKSDVKQGAKQDAKQDAKQMSGISILGNQDSPKSLVIVPWKSSEIGAGVGLENSLNDRAAPVDRDVFARQLRYYAIRAGGPCN